MSRHKTIRHTTAMTRLTWHDDATCVMQRENFCIFCIFDILHKTIIVDCQCELIFWLILCYHEILALFFRSPPFQSRQSLSSYFCHSRIKSRCETLRFVSDEYNSDCSRFDFAHWIIIPESVVLLCWILRRIWKNKELPTTANYMVRWNH